MSPSDLQQKAPPHVLTIAGSDSGGGAGIQADLKTIEAWRCYGSSVLTGLTAQNTTGVKAVHEVPTDFVLQQMQAIWDDQPPVAIKLGMLTSSSTVQALATFLEERSKEDRPSIVLDPVMISTSGHSLVGDDTMSAIRDKLVKQVDWITPNIPEGITLSGCSTKVETIDDMLKLVSNLAGCLAIPNILLKGGHLSIAPSSITQLKESNKISKLRNGGVGVVDMIWLDEDEEGECIEVLNGYRDTLDTGVSADTPLLVDLLYKRDEKRTTAFVSRKVDTTSTHGTGCTLSSALACSIALNRRTSPVKGGDYTPDNVRICQRAIEYTKSAIASAYPFGKGFGPLNHTHLSYIRALAPPTPANPHPFTSHLIRSNLPLWKSYVRHPFVVQLGNGTLPRETFERYITQDYLYLQHYARAHALGAYKASTFADISALTSIAQHISRESQMHVAYCESFGISLATLQSTPESAPCAAYARYILDVGAQGDLLDLYMAVASCLIGYGEVGLWLMKQVEKGEAKLEGNLYRKWIEDYSGKDFQDAVNRGIENLEQRVAADPPGPERLERLTKIWLECVRLERDFWEQ